MHQYSYTILDIKGGDGKNLSIPSELQNTWLGQVSHEFFSSTLAHKIANLCRRRLTGNVSGKIDTDFCLCFGIIKLHKNGQTQYTKGKRHEGRIFNAKIRRKDQPVVIKLKDGTEYTVNWDVNLEDSNDSIRSYFSDKKGDILEQMHDPHEIKSSVTVSKRKSDQDTEQRESKKPKTKVDKPPKDKKDPPVKDEPLPKSSKAKETKPPPEVKTKETKPKEVKPKETKPKEVKPKETKPKETKPKEVKPKEKTKK